MKSRPPKKTDSLEVRLPPETKRAFMERCKAERVSASEIVRGYIEDHLARPARKPVKEIRMPLSQKTFQIGATAAAGALALTTLFVAQSAATPDIVAMFKRLDADGDGRLTLQEFAPKDGGPRLTIGFVSKDGPAPPPSDASLAPPPNVMLHVRKVTPPLAGTAPPTTGVSIETLYAGMDRDGDGVVGFDEFKAHHVSVAAQSFATLDGDGDGRVTRLEFDEALPPFPGADAHHAEIFVGLDGNRDGVLTRKEFGPQ